VLKYVRMKHTRDIICILSATVVIKSCRESLMENVVRVYLNLRFICANIISNLFFLFVIQIQSIIFIVAAHSAFQSKLIIAIFTICAAIYLVYLH